MVLHHQTLISLYTYYITNSSSFFLFAHKIQLTWKLSENTLDQVWIVFPFGVCVCERDKEI